MKDQFLKYCKECTLPETRPNTEVGEDGICSACKYYKVRKEIDWKVRKDNLLKIFDKYRNKYNKNFDCIIPCSGGKDSTYQTLKVKEFGLNPLCVTVSACHLTEIGRRNIENIKNLGVDYIEYSANPNVRKKLNKFCLKTVGDISWPESISIFCTVARLSAKLNIPLIIWGENPENENGGPKRNSDIEGNKIQKLDHAWMEEFGGTNGLRASDILYSLRNEGIKDIDLLPYTYPEKKELSTTGSVGVFLGYYIAWDGHMNAMTAKKNGFTFYHKNVEGSIVPYENLDNYQKRVHDYFKYLKYGYDRVTDWSSLAIRRGRISRSEGIKLTINEGGKFPNDYLGKSLEEILSYIDMTVDEFKIVCDKFTNKKLFKKNPDGTIFTDNHGNIIKNNYDNI